MPVTIYKITGKDFCCIFDGMMGTLKGDDQRLETLRDAYDHADGQSKPVIISQIALHRGWSLAGDFLKGIAEDEPMLREISCKLLREWHQGVYENSAVLLQPEKAYVMHVYYRSTFHEQRLPKDIQEILREIPFIFGENG